MKNRMIYSVWFKAILFILTVSFALSTFVFCVATVYMADAGAYSSQKTLFIKNTYSYTAYNDMSVLYSRCLVNTPNNEYASEYLKSKNIDHFECRDENGQIVYSVGEKTDSPYVFTDMVIIEQSYTVHKTHTLTITVSQTPVQNDAYLLLWTVANTLYSIKDTMLVFIALFALLTFTCTLAVLVSSGKRNGIDGIYKGPLYRIPVEILVFFVLFGLFAGYYFAKELNIDDSPYLCVPYILVYVTFGISCFLGIAVTTTSSIKARGLFKRSLLYYSYVVLKYVICSVPLAIKASAAFLAVALFDLFTFYIFETHFAPQLFLVTFMLSRGILFILTVYFFSNLNRLKKGAEQIADSAGSARINTDGMVLELKAHAETLNTISGGISSEVEKRMKSERLKTELITNVTHDLKTPLTSVISYSDLICKEKTENERIKEYSAVLLRQSARLKRLIDDLLEASKAQTGNIEVKAEILKADVLIDQALGEYEERFCEKGLTVITSKPDGEVSVNADGRHLWRIFDNLLNNIYKYAMAGTRVYVELSDKPDHVSITFKNTSESMLCISADELTERFTRADNSRNSEGNGLGLSIAKGLATAQGGELIITLDGDLFKATLKLPK
ncbi:MAG: HAMP domain-containing histidine kinase [Clostridia bacterium]|nr:HAMP domain-containing histidine kinase [Clostridia bacterium]